METDFDILASRATEPEFYRAPWPDNAAYQLMPYQHAGVEFALSRNHCLLGDAPGLGKTAQAIAIGNAIGATRTLVACPAALRLNWEREIWIGSTIENVSTYPVLKSTDGISDQANYVIISYDLLRKPAIIAAIRDLEWDHLILDEAHYIKDPRKNARTRAVVDEDGIAGAFGRITLASGTILPNSPAECFNAVRLLNHAAIEHASLETFMNNYYEEGEGWVHGPVTKRDKNGNEYTVHERHWSNSVRNKPCNLADLQRRLRKHIMVRRLKSQVLTQLPPPTWHPFPLVPDAKIRAALKHPGWHDAEKLYELDEDAFHAGIPIDGAISTARRELGEAKAPAVAEYCAQLLSEGVEKLLVAAHHNRVIEILQERLEEFGLVVMLATTSNARRQQAVDAFQTQDRYRVILGQTQVIGVGHTLTAAQDAVLAEPDWTPGVNQQLLDRLHRIGQRGEYVMGHVPVVPGSIDEKIIGRAIAKDGHIYEALDKVS
jgi:SWI/SNF-related matrix-associated actin-dependent regulator 1 of chromatin subfamily A